MKILNNRRSEGQKVGRSETATTRCPTRTLGHDRQYGFTLVELVIVIAIVIILSVVSVPIYRGYTRNAKMSEGYALLGVILSAQKAYFSQYGNFLSARHGSAKGVKYTCNEEVLGIDARGNKYFTCFLVGDISTVGGDYKYNFYALVRKPEELGPTSILRMDFDVTSSGVGAKFREGNDL